MHRAFTVRQRNHHPEVLRSSKPRAEHEGNPPQAGMQLKHHSCATAGPPRHPTCAENAGSRGRATVAKAASQGGGGR